jgi:GH25 family lysozyme M1 (1,4-beta-N-acetylmuramidase)
VSRARVLTALVIACLSLVGLAAPAGAFVTGVDVASWQHPGTSGTTCGSPIDWYAVKNAGHSFAYIKATESTTYTNPCFAQDWQGAANAGLYRGAYHYARPALPISTALDQARYFVSRAGSMTGSQDLPGFLDLEETGGLGQSDLAQWTRTFLGEVTRLTGKAPMIYVGRFFWRDAVGNPADIGQQYRLWLPDYHCQRFDGSLFCDPNTDSYAPSGFAGWSSWTFWQNYSVGAVPGIPGGVDMNRFCCDLASLSALAGSGSGGGSPFGDIGQPVLTAPDRVTVSGWAIDPDTSSPIAVHVYVVGPNSAMAGTPTVANISRPDIGASYPGFSANHGFSVSVPVATGADNVCAFGINVQSGSNTLLGCRSLGGAPFGSVDVLSLTSPGHVHVAGWSIDPDTSASTQVHIYVDGVGTAYTANRTRADVGAFYSSAGPNHGFDEDVPMPAGTHTVCVFAINALGPGSNTLLQCRIVTSPGGNPYGSIDVVRPGVGNVTVAGWAIDPDTASPTQVHVWIDGLGTALVANGARPDVGAIYPLNGASHGYAATIPVPPGPHNVCLFAINTAGEGTNQLMGCRTVQVPSGDPFGSVDVVRGGPGNVTVAGWAIDPDTASPTQVHVYVDGVGTALTADGNRPDVGNAFPASGPAHGFSASIPLAPGSHDVCLFAINVAGTGSNRLMTCRTVQVSSGDPFGSIDVATIGNGQIRVAGWAIDPETQSPIQVAVYVASGSTVEGASASAGIDRPDVGAFFGLGSAHGYDYSRPMVGSGNQYVCVFAINVGQGANTLLGCRLLLAPP